MSNSIIRIAQKEFSAFFSSLTALIFFGAYVGTTLFVFFWVDPFFARNIADVRPMFEWMPVLLIFLVPALTMRMWSEERRAGTLELLLTVPVSNFDLVLGKFLACLALVGIALVLTLPIPITVGLFLGRLDWGPVLGGYLATLFLASSYAAIGLYLSAKSDNQIVSLLTSCFVCTLFYLVGSDPVTSIFNNDIAEILKLFGSGSRFQSITRGIVDFRDLYYYLSITCIFLSLNILGLEKLRWSNNRMNKLHMRWASITILSIANFIAANLWLQQIGWARFDLTEGQSYTISSATRVCISKLQEPLLLRGYFSRKTHPLLAPLIPRLRDLMKEYAIASKGKIRVEFLDPLEKPELEKEAGESYGIKPVVFQSASKYQAALTNSYCDILVKYGDQFEKLSFRDLIEVKTQSERKLEVELRNPEYQITSAIKKVLYAYQGEANLLAGMQEPTTLTAYFSPDSRLPEQLKNFKQVVNELMADWQQQSGGKLAYKVIDPDSDGGTVAKQLQKEYGFRPMIVGLFDRTPFWFYMTLKRGDQTLQVPLPEGLTKLALERGLKASLRHFSKGYLKTIGVLATQQMDMRGGTSDAFTVLRKKLNDIYSLQNVSLSSGHLSADVDVLCILAPEKLSDKEIFAIDQFLMKGGTVLLSTSPFNVSFQQALSAKPIESGLEKWLSNNGIEIAKSMVLDPQNTPLPMPVRRNIGNFTVEETALLEYPYFVDVRGDNISKEGNLAAGVEQVTVNWVSPITIDAAKNRNRHVIRLLQSSPAAWTNNTTKIQPKPNRTGFGFPQGQDTGTKLLAVIVEGSFDSFFKDKKIPSSNVDSKANEEKAKSTSGQTLQETDLNNVIVRSPDSAKIIVFASNNFLDDQLLWLASQSNGVEYLSPIELVENVIDWSVADRDLLAIRGRTHFARTLKPIKNDYQVGFEYLNYALAIGSLAAIWLMRRQKRAQAEKRYRALLETEAQPPETVAPEEIGSTHG